jgi:hypothetical protein
VNVTPWDGKKIKKPGWYSGIPIEVYHSPGLCAGGPAVSSSNLRKCWSKSAKHMYATWAENPKREDEPPTRPQVLGIAAHHLILGQDFFNTKFVQQPETYNDKKLGFPKPWNNNADWCRAWQKEQRDAKRTVVTIKELETIVRIAESLQTQGLVNDGMLIGHVEVSGFIKDKVTGLWIKVRPDVIPMAGPDFVDLKTARDVTTMSLQYSIREYGYHMQGALIWEVCEVLQQPFSSFWLLFCETTNPWCARPIQLTDDDLGIGRTQNEALLKQIRSCIDDERWPGPGEGELPSLSMSHDERARIAARLKFEYGVGA